MASTYGATTPKQLNQFRMEEVSTLMALAHEDEMRRFSTLNALLDIPRPAISFQATNKGGLLNRYNAQANRVRQAFTSWAKRFSAILKFRKTGNEIDPESVRAVEEKFGVRFLKQRDEGEVDG